MIIMPTAKSVPSNLDNIATTAKWHRWEVYRMTHKIRRRDTWWTGEIWARWVLPSVTPNDHSSWPRIDCKVDHVIRNERNKVVQQWLAAQHASKWLSFDILGWMKTVEEQSHLLNHWIFQHKLSQMCQSFETGSNDTSSSQGRLVS